MKLRSLHTALLVLIAAHPCAASQVSVTDDLQRTIVLPSPAQRVVSLAPSITETLFAIGAGNQVVGVTDYCNYPAEAATKQRVGGIINPSIEAIVSLQPDLIVLSMEGNARSDFEKITSFGIPVFVSNPRTLDGISTSILQLGKLTGRSETAQRLTQSMALRADSIARKTQRMKNRTCLFFVSLQPIIVVGRETFLAELIGRAGGTNTVAQTASTYPQYSREAVLKDNPDVLIFMSDVLTNSGELTRFYPEWRNLTAVKRRRIYRVDPDVVSRPGPRAIDGLELLYRIINESRE